MTSESLLFCMIYFQLSCLQNSKYFQACCFPNSNISNATLSELLDYPNIFHQSICKSYNLTDRYILFILAGFDGYILQLRYQIFSAGCLPNSDETPLGCLLSSNGPVSPLSSRRLFLSIILTFALWTLLRWGQTKGFSTAKKVVCWVLQNLRRPSNKISSNITSPLSCRSLFTPLQLYWYVVVV